MNFSAKSNMYSAARDQVLERYAAHINTPADPCTYQFCVVSYKKPSPAVAQALESSAEALGYRKDGYFSIALTPDEDEAARALNPADLFCLIEGIDPFAVVIAEDMAASLAQEAYRRSDDPITPDEFHDSAAPGEPDEPDSLVAATNRPTCGKSEAGNAANKAFLLPRDSYLHLLGRDTVVFSSFEAMLANPAAKQRAWALLKKLKR